ncbi:REP element-mobilizing transposase RayT [Thiocapsa rosea]|uniref:REP element-mobilizing transposase RayT n=1 Tax=Thiocapsa rosea TaxID=69360 RepID=A0A495V1Z6_9GAMM|nr:transposase [Thiocapsa rosea]RKT43354.1 REP element-mobilizing transposase RayT [Thiocapsa rosea]
MARLPRVVVPGLPHHVTQRGNRRQRTFFGDEDYAGYRHLLSTSCRACGTQVLVYCLMPNHVHLILVPTDEFGLRDALGEAHCRYMISDWRRFIGEPDATDIAHLLHAHAGTCRPLGPDSFVEALEERLGRPLKRQKPGPTPFQKGTAPSPKGKKNG